MNKMLLRFRLFTLSFFVGSVLCAQSNTATSGGNFSGTTGNVSYTIGQIDYSYQIGVNGNINQGIQQPYEIYGTNSLPELGENIQLTVGPNPIIDFLILSNNSGYQENLYFFLTDSNGKKLINKAKLDGSTEISMIDYPVGMYYLIVTNHSEDIKTFKIIKN